MALLSFGGWMKMGSMFKAGMFAEQSAIMGWLEGAKFRRENAESSNAKGTEIHKMDAELSEIVQIAEQANIVQIAEQASVAADEGTAASTTHLNLEIKPPSPSS
ncbi:hypothetical protein L484_016501 [Morus notabilis]|uniref:Uncharacterized protein n=1 Tax=Morus notabilis TaxID=981085 RepID=W9QGK3_9ROSA|nr:hypothetical protein L484_016501 [Morus notabilis]